MIICPPPRRPERCADAAPPRPALINTGRIFTDPASAPPAIGRARMQRGRHLVGLLSAFRCPHCEHDRVLDPAGQARDLDDTDYTDDGS